MAPATRPAAPTPYAASVSVGIRLPVDAAAVGASEAAPLAGELGAAVALSAGTAAGSSVSVLDSPSFNVTFRSIADRPAPVPAIECSPGSTATGCPAVTG